MPGDMELDAADWLNIMILHIGFRVNRASKKVRYQAEAPASGLDWHARADHSRSRAAERVAVCSSCTRAGPRLLLRVQLPGSVTLPELREGLIEPGPRGTGTAGLVREELLAAGTLQRVGLEIKAFLGG
jgi:hypothetical protein